MSRFFFAVEIRLPNKCILKKFYLAQRRRARREKNLGVSASLRDKRYHQQEFLIGSDSGENAVKSFLRFNQIWGVPNFSFASSIIL